MAYALWLPSRQTLNLQSDSWRWINIGLILTVFKSTGRLNQGYWDNHDRKTFLAELQLAVLLADEGSCFVPVDVINGNTELLYELNRHMKCDMRQPICSRCEKRGTECLGYGHNQRGVARSALPKVTKPRPILPKGQEADRRILTQPKEVSLISKSSGEESLSDHFSLNLQLCLGETSEFGSSSIETPQLSGLILLDTGAEDRREGYDTSQQVIHSYPQRSSSYSYQCITEPSASINPFLIASQLLPSSPSDPIAAYLGGSQFEHYALSLFERTIGHAYFKPMKDHLAQLRGAMVSRLRASPSSRWIILISIKIYEDIIEGDRSQTDIHVHWIERTAASIYRRFGQNLTPQETKYLRADWLEISIISSIFGRGPNAYVALRNATPTFLQGVYSLPGIWSGGSDPTLIPLLEVIKSEDYSLSTYTLVDCMCALSFGLPQQIEYDTTARVLPDDFLPHEWATGIPTEFHLLLADINACRDKSPRARDWREIEENHRRITRSKLSDPTTGGLDFVPVLDHLWHGAGLGGHAITWSDYLHSRETLIPVPM
ncbi:fungal zn(2)-Cys(6) binuclear cluster domain-containing protein [Rhizoctonia solani AG-1 IA]|uniref:Fungal zn(2)-Cys(6) binuclear cluster domain-containing protein n=1 Tax=Thanatephorus cucumeris (strain AG1-IA) TaxID=983506 RepID=L8WTN1_THACA|nr:fungal zn(2)-Cys(6) binuclear cluster domain-containing protein [Rhizoctonia solani AG-1 IA]